MWLKGEDLNVFRDIKPILFEQDGTCLGTPGRTSTYVLSNCLIINNNIIYG